MCDGQSLVRHLLGEVLAYTNQSGLSAQSGAEATQGWVWTVGVPEVSYHGTHRLPSRTTRIHVFAIH
jgi:hypothetical protein